MKALGYYAKYVGPDSENGEGCLLTKVIDEWDYGFTIDNYDIDLDGIYFEDLSWTGKKLDYENLGQPINQKKI